MVSLLIHLTFAPALQRLKDWLTDLLTSDVDFALFSSARLLVLLLTPLAPTRSCCSRSLDVVWVQVPTLSASFLREPSSLPI